MSRIFISIRKSLSWDKALIVFNLRTCTFVGIQAPIPKFKGNDKEDKRNYNQPTNIKESILFLQEIAGRIVGRKGKRHDKANQPTKKRIVNRNRILGKVIKHIEDVNHGSWLLGPKSDAGCRDFQGSINQGRKRDTN